MKHHFNSKEKYLAFRAAWTKAVQSGQELTTAHFILYNVLRDKEPLHGFSPITNESKLESVAGDPWRRSKVGVNKLHKILKLAKTPEDVTRFQKIPHSQLLSEFCGFFGDTVDHQMLADVHDIIDDHVTSIHAFQQPAIWPDIKPIKPSLFDKFITLITGNK